MSEAIRVVFYPCISIKVKEFPRIISALHCWMINYRPKLERVLDRSIKAFLPGLLRIERFASEMSAVTLVIVILKRIQENKHYFTTLLNFTVHKNRFDNDKEKLTFLQICVLESQIVLFASCR